MKPWVIALILGILILCVVLSLYFGLKRKSYPHKNERVYVWIHIALLRRWEEILKEELDLLKSSGLAKHAKIFYCVVGGPKEKVEPLMNGLDHECVEDYEDVRLHECPTLHHLHNFAKENPNKKVLYIHTKGTSRPKDSNSDEWRRYMLYFLVGHYKECLHFLDSYSTVGVHLIGENHYSGNFWWAQTNHLSTLDHLGENACWSEKPMTAPNHPRMKAEYWCLSRPKKGSHLSIHQLPPDHPKYNAGMTLYSVSALEFDYKKDGVKKALVV